MRNRHIIYLLIFPSFCLIFALSGCYQEEDDKPTVYEVSRLNVVADDITEVTNALLQKIGLRSGNTRFAVGGTSEEGFKIDWERIKQLIDSTGKQTYTFGVEDMDNDPRTFYNLIFQLTPNNEPYQPYLLKYTMDEDFALEYFKTGDFSGFKGTISKTFLSNIPKNLQGNVYAGEGDEQMVGEPCPGEVTIDDGPDPGPSGGGSGGGTDSDSGWGSTTSVIRCEHFVQATDWYKCLTPDCSVKEYVETTYEFSTECSIENSQYSAYGGDDSCDPKDEDLPIIEPGIHPDNLENYLLNCKYTPDECLREALKSFKEWGGEEGKAVAKLIEDLMSTPGLTLEEANEIYALAVQFAKNLSGQYLMEIFSIENISIILSFGITNNLGVAARQKLAEVVSNYGARFTLSRGLTVLGKYPEYLNLAEKIGANRFSVPSHIWNSMTAAEQWAANVQFLDDVILRGDDIILSNRVSNVADLTGFFKKEIEYLISKGYGLSENGLRLIR